MDKDFRPRQARLIRSLADQADCFIKRRFLRLAEHNQRSFSILSTKNGDVQDADQNR